MKLSKGVEIGAGDYAASFLLKNRDVFDQIELYEPNPVLFEDLRSKIGNFDRVNLFDFAVSNYSSDGDIFFNVGRSSFLKGAESFLNLTHKESPDEGTLPEEYLIGLSTSVKVKNIKEIDNEIDFLSLTCNGCEFNILSAMQSRPKMVRVCAYVHNQHHRQYYSKISQWMSSNDYILNGHNSNKLGTFSELFFVKSPR